VEDVRQYFLYIGMQHITSRFTGQRNNLHWGKLEIQSLIGVITRCHF